MSKYVPTPTERKMAECERLYRQVKQACDECGEGCGGEDCSHGMCEACEKLYKKNIEDCAKQFGIDLPDDHEGVQFDD